MQWSTPVVCLVILTMTTLVLVFNNYNLRKALQLEKQLAVKRSVEFNTQIDQLDACRASLVKATNSYNKAESDRVQESKKAKESSSKLQEEQANAEEKAMEIKRLQEELQDFEEEGTEVRKELEVTKTELIKLKEENARLLKQVGAVKKPEASPKVQKPSEEEKKVEAKPAAANPVEAKPAKAK